MPLFVDSNVLVYARDAADPAKHARAREWMRHLWETETSRLSVHVLQEYYVSTTRKLRPGLTPAVARADVRDLVAWRPVTIGAMGIESAWSIEDRSGLSFWDSLVVAAAQMTDCDVLLTEDLQHGFVIDGLRVVDPFQTPVDAPRVGS